MAKEAANQGATLCYKWYFCIQLGIELLKQCQTRIAGLLQTRDRVELKCALCTWAACPRM
jgi:hypothetical protein